MHRSQHSIHLVVDARTTGRREICESDVSDDATLDEPHDVEGTSDHYQV